MGRINPWTAVRKSLSDFNFLELLLFTHTVSIRIVLSFFAQRTGTGERTHTRSFISLKVVYTRSRDLIQFFHERITTLSFTQYRLEKIRIIGELFILRISGVEQSLNTAYCVMAHNNTSACTRLHTHAASTKTI